MTDDIEPRKRPTPYRSPAAIAQELRQARKLDRRKPTTRTKMPAPALSRRTGSTKPTYWPNAAGLAAEKVTP